MNKLSVKAIVFDFDGVLAESVSVKGDAFYDLYEDAGKEIQEKVLAHHLANGGVSRYDKIRHHEAELLGRPATEEEVEERAQLFSDLVEDKVVASDWVKGAKEFLEHASGSLPLFVASATPQEELKRIIAGREMTHYFKSIYGSPQKKAEHLRTIMDEHGWLGDDVVMIGDTISDYNAAQAVGAHFIGRHAPGMPLPFPEDTAWAEDLTTLTDFINV